MPYNLFFNSIDKGTVLSLKDNVAQVAGLSKVFSGELITDLFKNKGLVLNLEESSISVIMFSSKKLGVGSSVLRTYVLASTISSPLDLGQVLDSLGTLLSRSSTITLLFSTFVLRTITSFMGSCVRLIEAKAPGILNRQSVKESLFTGTIALDCLVPLGRGQRELIIGDRQTGKTSIAFDALLNQAPYDIAFTVY